MITVRLLNVLVERSALKQREFAVEAADGLRVRDLVATAGLEDRWVQIVILNGRIARLDDLVVEGDQVTLSPVIAGG